MKALLFLAIFLTSCTSVYFTSVQTGGGVELKEFPNELCGTWRSGIEKITVSGAKIELTTKSNQDSIPEVEVEVLELSDSIRLFYTNDYYFLNIKGDNWFTFPICVTKNGDIEVTELSVSRMMKIKNIDYESFLYQNSVIDTIATNRIYDEDWKISQVVVNGQLDSKTLIRSSDKLSKTIYKKDGTVQSITRKKGGI